MVKLKKSKRIPPFSKPQFAWNSLVVYAFQVANTIFSPCFPAARSSQTKNPGAPHPGYLLGGGKYEMKGKVMVISLLLLVYT
jgi:hypothetical protein